MWCNVVRLQLTATHLMLHILFKVHFCMKPTATHCTSLPITATHGNSLQLTATHCTSLPITATHYNSLQLTATHCTSLPITATHCNSLQLTATHCNSLQLTATHCTSLQLTVTHCNSLQLTVTHCNSLQLTATHCNRLQLTATHCNTPNRAPSRYLLSFWWREPWLLCGNGRRTWHPCQTSRKRFFFVWKKTLYENNIYTWKENVAPVSDLTKEVFFCLEKNII